jgi:transcription initiation factor TFIIE subunit alpha
MGKKTKVTRTSARAATKKIRRKSVAAKGKKIVVKKSKAAANKDAKVAIKSKPSKITREIPSGGIPNQEVLDGVGRALEDAIFLDYVAKNIGSQANEVLRELSKGARKDEALAETVNIKLNEVRRVLNLLNKHGIVRYDVKRDSSGWLTFEWHVDHVALSDFYKVLSQKVESPLSSLPENCNDFFVCGGCSKKQGLLYPFDVAYEKSFKCNCGKSLEALTRSEAESYMRN